MNLTNLKSGSKIILTKEFTTQPENKWVTLKTLPKNLALSLVSLHVTKFGKTLIFQVLRAKPIVQKYYSELKPEDYASSRSWRKNGYNIVRLYVKDADRFIDEAEYRDFDEEYLELTHPDYKK